MESKEYVQKIYASYLKAQEQRGAGQPARHPEYSRAVLRALAEQAGMPVIMVTGSRGKGSVASMTAALLEKRQSVGLFTGPHVFAFNERIRLNGEPIADQDLVRCLEQAFSLFETAEKSLSAGDYISPMAYQGAAALLYYIERKPDLCIFECGKGVKSDDIGNLPRELGIINRIMPEHMPELGTTLAEIAEEKAAIMDEGCRRCFTAAQTPEVMAVLRAKAEESGCELVEGAFGAEEIKADRYGTACALRVGDRAVKNVRLRLRGAYQAQNAALALAAALDVCPDLSDEEIRGALFAVTIPGRLEVLSEEPYVLFDACLTRESAAEVRKFLIESGLTDIMLVLALSDDKDYEGVAEEMRGLALGIILAAVKNQHYNSTNEQLVRIRESFGAFRTGPGQERIAKTDPEKKSEVPIERMPDLKEAVEAAKERGLPVVILGLGAARGEMEG